MTTVDIIWLSTGALSGFVYLYHERNRLGYLLLGDFIFFFLLCIIGIIAPIFLLGAKYSEKEFFKKK